MNDLSGTKFWPVFCLIISSQAASFQTFDNDEKACYPRSSSYEVRAVLVPCHPHPYHRRRYCGQAGKLQGFDSDVCEQGKLKDCIKKVVITLKMTNVGPTNCRKQYVVVDEVYDYQTDTKQKLLYPYVLKIKQEPLLQTYRLDCESSVKERCRAMEGVEEEGRKHSRRRKKPWMQKIPWVECDNKFTYTIQKVKRSPELNPQYQKYFNGQTMKTNPYLQGGQSMKADESEQYNKYIRYMNYENSFGNQKFCPKTAVKEREKRILNQDNLNNYPFGLDGEKDVFSNIEYPSTLTRNQGCDSLSEYLYFPNGCIFTGSIFQVDTLLLTTLWCLSQSLAVTKIALCAT